MAAAKVAAEAEAREKALEDQRRFEEEKKKREQAQSTGKKDHKALMAEATHNAKLEAWLRASWDSKDQLAK